MVGRTRAPARRPHVFNTVDLARLTNLADAARAKARQPHQHHTGRSWYRITDASSDVATAAVYLYDMIGEWGVTAADFTRDLRAVTAPTIDLHVSCEGGEVFDGIAIYTALCSHPARVTAHVDGLAASAASFVVQAADHRIMGRNARMMIHDAHGFTVGNAADHREMATLLDDISDNIAGIYADRCGGDTATWRSAMRGSSDGTWYTAQAAVDAGLADEVATPTRQPGTDPAPSDQAPPVGPALGDDWAALTSALTEPSTMDDLAHLRGAAA